MTVTSAVTSAVEDADLPSASEATRKLGRVALVTQGVLYAVVGLLAARVAAGDEGAKPSQRGAIASVARQPFGRVLLVILALGLACHALWRIALAVRGDPGEGDDSGSVVKRLANVGRAAIYIGFTVAAVRVLAHTSGGGEGSTQKRSTARVLDWPGGRFLVIAAGAAIVGAGLWNLKKAITRSFLDKLDTGGLDEGKQRIVVVLGVAGYVARFAAFSLVGWFLIQAAWDRNPGKARSLDQSLKAMAEGTAGRWLLFGLAIGLVMFGAFRVLDGCLRKPSEITHA